MRIGAHVSIADHLYSAVDRAAAIGCETMQIFPGNPRGWKILPFPKDDIVEFTARKRRAGIYPVAVHLPYLVNLCSPSIRVRNASAVSIQDSLSKAVEIEAQYIVMHPGSHGGDGIDIGIERLVSGIGAILEEDFGPVKILLENTAGAGYTIGSTIEEIAAMIDGLNGNGRVGLCFDTCHAYAAGYDIASEAGLDEFLGSVDSLIGLDRLALIHANDCRGHLGSRLDRHQHLGQGHIGLDGFRRIIRRGDIQDAAIIIETPRNRPRADYKNLELLKRVRGD